MLARLTETETPPPRLLGPVRLDAELRPAQALSQRGMLLVMGSMGAMSLMLGLSLSALGGWPVLGFLGLDLLLLWVAFRLYARRAARLRETVALDAARIVVSRTDSRGSTRWWQAATAFARLERREQPHGATGLALCAGGASIEIGQCLSPAERDAFARRLERALAEARASPARTGAASASTTAAA